MAEQELTEDEARDLARSVYEQHNKPVLDYPAGDTIGDSYKAERIEGGWSFRPAIASINEDPQLASNYPYYVVSDDRQVHRRPYAEGPPDSV